MSRLPPYSETKASLKFLKRDALGLVESGITAEVKLFASLLREYEGTLVWRHRDGPDERFMSRAPVYLRVLWEGHPVLESKVWKVMSVTTGDTCVTVRLRHFDELEAMDWHGQEQKRHQVNARGGRCAVISFGLPVDGTEAQMLYYSRPLPAEQSVGSRAASHRGCATGDDT